MIYNWRTIFWFQFTVTPVIQSLSSDKLSGFIKAQAFSISDSLFFLTGTYWLWTGTDSWFFTRWVPGPTITFCNKITALSALGIVSMFPSLFSSTKAASQSLDADDTLWRFLDYEQSFFFLVRRAKRGRHGNDHARDLKARDGRGTKKERLPLASFLASRGFAVRRLLARELPSLNLEKTRDCLQSKRFSSRVTILLHGRDFFSQSTNWLTRR